MSYDNDGLAADSVSSKYGAPMGRTDILEDTPAKARLFRVELKDGDYDWGGAYWGNGVPLFCAWGDGFRAFRRYASLADAMTGFLDEFPELALTMGDGELDDFTRAYIGAALWSTDDNSDHEAGGEPLDANYGIGDIDEATLRAMMSDCDAFQVANYKQICPDNYEGDLRQWNVYEMAGHYFWLTRCGHGTGFWDCAWKEPAASILTEAAKAAGEFNLYVGDDGKIYGN